MNRKSRVCFLPAVLAVALSGAAAAQAGQHSHAPGSRERLAEVDRRGAQAMGFDQERTVHQFRLTETGGYVDVQAKDAADQQSIAQVQQHLAEIAKLFAAGDFSKPAFIHAQDPPGVEVMKQRRAAIRYRFVKSARGGRLNISSDDAEARAAIHAFLRFQIEDHQTHDPQGVEKKGHAH